MATASGHAPATPTIKGRLRPRPNRNILQARSILIAIPALVVSLVLSVFFLGLVFHSGADLIVTIWPAYIVSAGAYLATRGFRDRRMWALGLALLIGIVLVAAAVFLIASVFNHSGAAAASPSASGIGASPGATLAAASPAAAGSPVAAGASPGATDAGAVVGVGASLATSGNIAFGMYTLAAFFLILGVPLLWNLFRGISWFTSGDASHERAVAQKLVAETGGLTPTVTALSEIQATDAERPAGEALVSVRGLKKHFPILGGVLRRNIGTIYAVDGVDFDVFPGEVFAVVGESGCGKTTLGRTLLQLTPPTAGKVIFDGYELGDVDPEDMRPLRRRMQIIFQDPFGSLNPRMPVSDIIGEGLLAQGVTNRAERDKRVEDSLEIVGLRRDYTRRFPHEFSGGQRQRIGIARALALTPDFVVCDEPVSALDVSIQSQVLNLLLDLKRDFNLTYLFISHNLSVVEYFSDRIAVMYLGRIVELGTVEQLYRNARHPYTIALLSAIPDADPRKRRKRLVLKGDVPSPAAPPAGCRFHTRCWLYEQLGKPERCTTEDPSLRVIEGAAHQAACHFSEEISDTTVRETVANQDVIATATAAEG
jgi:oligopeptide/dipeptide ABC transporter ATP-binding protein